MKELERKKPTLAQALTPIIFMVVALALGYGVLTYINLFSIYSRNNSPSIGIQMG